jgi:hypothetical protein
VIAAALFAIAPTIKRMMASANPLPEARVRSGGDPTSATKPVPKGTKPDLATGSEPAVAVAAPAPTQQHDAVEAPAGDAKPTAPTEPAEAAAAVGD